MPMAERRKSESFRSASDYAAKAASRVQARTLATNTDTHALSSRTTPEAAASASAVRSTDGSARRDERRSSVTHGNSCSLKKSAFESKLEL